MDRKSPGRLAPGLGQGLLALRRHGAHARAEVAEQVRRAADHAGEQIRGQLAHPAGQHTAGHARGVADGQVDGRVGAPAQELAPHRLARLDVALEQQCGERERGVRHQLGQAQVVARGQLSRHRIGLAGDLAPACVQELGQHRRVAQGEPVPEAPAGPGQGVGEMAPQRRLGAERQVVDQIAQLALGLQIVEEGVDRRGAPVSSHAPQERALAAHRPGDVQGRGGLRVVAGERRHADGDAAHAARFVAHQLQRARAVAIAEHGSARQPARGHIGLVTRVHGRPGDRLLDAVSMRVSRGREPDLLHRASIARRTGGEQAGSPRLLQLSRPRGQRAARRAGLLAFALAFVIGSPAPPRA